MKPIAKEFSTISLDNLNINPCTAIGEDWLLITAGNREGWNTMTAAWGGLGFLWRKPVVFAFVRYSRYTYEFMERFNHFTFSFFSPEWRKALTFCGSHSGREHDKAAETGLEPLLLEGVRGVTGPAVGFSQAETILSARKLYSGEIAPEDFTEMEIHSHYPGKDYHRMYVGEIEAVLERNKA